MSLDPITDHWVSLGGQQEPGAKALADMHDEGSIHGLHRQTRLDEASAELYSDTKAALDEAKARDTDKDDWESSREHRTWLSERYPDTNLDTYARGMLDWNRKFQTDPLAAREEWVRVWSRMPPFHHQSKAEAAKDGPPTGMKERDVDEWQRDRDTINGYREAAKDRADRDQYSSTAELRQQIKQATGLSVAGFLEKCRMIDTASLDDPVGIANRFAVFSGAPATEREAAERQHAANQHAVVSQVQAGLDRVVASGRLPGLGSDRVDNTIVAVLADSRFERVGDHGLDLQNAYNVALQWLAAGYNPEAKAAPANAPNKDDVDANLVVTYPDGSNSLVLQNLGAAIDRLDARLSEPSAADKARAASRSISGSPSPGATSNSQRHDASVEDDVRRAYRAASTSASI